MNKFEFDDYLERGWQCGANLFYNRRVFFSQCTFHNEKNVFKLEVYSFKAEKHGDHSFSPYVDKKGKYVDFILLIDRTYESLEDAKTEMLSAKIYDGKSFWEIGDKFEWLDDDGPNIVTD